MSKLMTPYEQGRNSMKEDILAFLRKEFPALLPVLPTAIYDLIKGIK